MSEPTRINGKRQHDPMLNYTPRRSSTGMHLLGKLGWSGKQLLFLATRLQGRVSPCDNFSLFYILYLESKELQPEKNLSALGPQNTLIDR